MTTDELNELHGWVQVNPENVVHLWEAPEDAEDPLEIAIVPSDWYEHNGTPITTCGLDMTYSGTYVLESEIKKTSD